MGKVIVGATMQESIRTTGAAVIGRRAHAMADPDWFVDNYEYQVPKIIIVVWRAAPTPATLQKKIQFSDRL